MHRCEIAGTAPVAGIAPIAGIADIAGMDRVVRRRRPEEIQEKAIISKLAVNIGTRFGGLHCNG